MASVSGVSARSYSEAELQAAVTALGDPERLRDAEALVASVAPDLQKLLAGALASGGWFEESHQAAVVAATGKPEGDERIAAIRTLLAEETRIGMMIGVAVGWALAEELRDNNYEENQR
jgi:hypothetical protein